MSGSDIYDFKSKGGAAIMVLILLVLVGFTGAMVYAAGWGDFEFNDHPATESERRLVLVIFPLMISPFLYGCVHGLLKHFNERIVWAEGQLSWTDSLGRERVRCSEVDITGERQDQLWANGLVRYEIETRLGNIRFLSSMPRCAELRARVAAHLRGEKTSSEQPAQIVRHWQAKTIYDYRSNNALLTALSPMLFLVVVVGFMRFSIEMTLIAIVPVGLIAGYFLCRYFLMSVQVEDGEIVFSNFLGKPSRRVSLSELRGVDEQTGESRWLRVVLEGGKSFIVSGDMRDYKEFYAELRRLTGSPEP